MYEKHKISILPQSKSDFLNNTKKYKQISLFF